MENISFPLRSAVIRALKTSVIYDGNVIPIWENFVQETPGYNKAISNFYDNDVEVYNLYKNATDQPYNSKCRSWVSSFQIQVTTVWPSDSGTSQVAEAVENEIYSRLTSPDGSTIYVDMGYTYNIWKLVTTGSRPLMFDDNDKRIWTRQITFEAWINKK